MTRFAFLLVSLVLAGCASSGGGSASRPVEVVRPTVPNVPRPLPIAGDLVVGRSAASLIALFGQPALDIREGEARKLQFAGETCVLDAYLYPPRSRGEPVATHADARLRDGRDTDRTACAESLRRR